MWSAYPYKAKKPKKNKKKQPPTNHSSRTSTPCTLATSLAKKRHGLGRVLPPTSNAPQLSLSLTGAESGNGNTAGARISPTSSPTLQAGSTASDGRTSCPFSSAGGMLDSQTMLVSEMLGPTNSQAREWVDWHHRLISQEPPCPTTYWLPLPSYAKEQHSHETE